MSLRILHLADLHLDTPVGGRTPAVRSKVRAALHEAFRRAIEAALEHEVDAFLVAGDAFDDPLLTQASAELFQRGLLQLARSGVDVAWCTGNHDPGGKNVRSKRGRAALLGLDDPARHGHPRLHVFRDQRPRTVDLTDSNGDLLGTLTSIGHRTDDVGENLAQKLERPSRAGSSPAVAMLHTQVEDAPSAVDHARYAPCTARDLAAAGFDYWALGHVHVQGAVPGAPAWYSGNPQGRNAKETGARGGLLVEVEAGEAPRVTALELAPLRFETLALERLENVDDLGVLARMIDEDKPVVDSDLVLRVRLSGPSPLARALASPSERAAACDELALELDLIDVELRTERLTAPLDLDDFHATESALREAHRLLVGAAGRDALAAELDEVELSPAAPPPGDPGRAAYVRELLAGANEDLLARAFRAEGTHR